VEISEVSGLHLATIQKERPNTISLSMKPSTDTSPGMTKQIIGSGNVSLKGEYSFKYAYQIC